MKKALITGVTGQDGSYLAEFLLSKGYVGIEIKWHGKGLDEKGVIESMDNKWKHLFKAGEVLIMVDPKYFRPTEVMCLRADATKARKVLGWNPKITFDELIKIMVDCDMKLAGLKPP